jgi:hypothetical protein
MDGFDWQQFEEFAGSPRRACAVPLWPGMREPQAWMYVARRSRFSLALKRTVTEAVGLNVRVQLIIEVNHRLRSFSGGFSNLIYAAPNMGI